jgi:dolichol-phosphate mannosyltransferase
VIAGAAFAAINSRCKRREALTMVQLNSAGGPDETKLIVVLPAYNEAAGLSSLLSAIKSALRTCGFRYRVILVDDGSTDQTCRVVKEFSGVMPLTVLRHETNAGFGSALRDGLLEALKNVGHSDFIVTMDADATHLPEQIPAMAAMIRSGCDIVIASRRQPGAQVYGVPVGRRILSFGIAQVCRLMFPTKGVRDYSSGYRAYRASVLQQAVQVYGDRLFEVRGFACTLDLLLKLRRLKVVFGETPIVLRYDLKADGTKMRVWATVLGTLSLLMRRRLRS